MNPSQDSDKPDTPPPNRPLDPHAQMQHRFRWQVDEFFNIADVCCRRWAKQPDAENAPERIAVYAHQACAEALFHTYCELQQAADALSHVLAGLGVQRGDRVAIVMPQRFETAAAFMAVFQMGAVAMPLSMLFGPEALAFRLQDSETRVAICDESSIASVNAVRAACPALCSVVATGQAAGQGDVDYAAAVAAQPRAFNAVKTRSEEAAVLIYTSGTTGQPKGALIPHRALVGNLPGFVCSQNGFGFDGVENATSNAVFWSPADWA